MDYTWMIMVEKNTSMRLLPFEKTLIVSFTVHVGEEIDRSRLFFPD
jgi:hypothetical protein